MKGKLIGLVLLLVWCVPALSQDVRFSQYYQAPVYLNPAFTGATGMARVGVNYRQQGTTSESAYTTMSAFGDYYVKDWYVSGGLLFLRDHDDYSGYTLTTVAVPLSYDFAISKNLIVKPALQGSFSQQSLDFGGFLFGDQIDANGNIIPGGSSEPLAVNNQLGYMDVATGVLAYGKNWWAGYAMHNLLQNNVSFVEGGEQTLAVRYTLHGGYTIDFSKRKSRVTRSVMPTFSYLSQGGFNQLDAGAILNIEPIIVGAMYRGIPTPFYTTDYSAVTGILGIRKFDLSIGYSYDLPLSNVTSPGGIHEISIVFMFDVSNPNATPRSSKRLKCPLFY